MLIVIVSGPLFVLRSIFSRCWHGYISRGQGVPCAGLGQEDHKFVATTGVSEAVLDLFEMVNIKEHYRT